jgi:hypothetical protein
MTFGHKVQIQRPAQPSGRQSLLPTAAATLCAFAIGALAVLGWNYLPASEIWPSLLKLFESSRTLTYPERLGRVATAPILKICISPALFNIRHEIDLEPGILLSYLEGDPRDRLPRIHTMPREHGVLEAAQMWGEVADCVYRQNGYKLCDIDNRALAVKAAKAFIGQADWIISQPQRKFAAEPGEVPALTTVRDRVLDVLRARLRTGVLIAEDFEGGVPAAIARVLTETQSVQTECVKQ